jgi:tetratricopeptide (TPR) repeat protein
MENLYELLGLPEDASAEDIKKAYRLLAKKYHPDSGNGDDEIFRRVNHAYNVLSRQESRNDYDKTLRNFRNRTSDFEAYTADVYEVSGQQVQKMFEELVRQTNLTRVRLKYKGKVLFDMPIATATAITAIGFILAPIPTLLLNVGMNKYFEMEVKNLVMDKYEEVVGIHEQGRLAEAEKGYQDIIGMSEYFVPAHLNLGMLYRQLGENRKAEDCFRKVLDIAPFGEVGAAARSNLENIRGF